MFVLLFLDEVHFPNTWTVFPFCCYCHFISFVLKIVFTLVLYSHRSYLLQLWGKFGTILTLDPAISPAKDALVDQRMHVCWWMVLSPLFSPHPTFISFLLMDCNYYLQKFSTRFKSLRAAFFFKYWKLQLWVVPTQ